MPEAEIEDVPKIKEYLEKNNISLKDLKETADELLYEKVIGDWKICKVKIFKGQFRDSKNRKKSIIWRSGLGKKKWK